MEWQALNEQIIINATDSSDASRSLHLLISIYFVKYIDLPPKYPPMV